MLHYSQWPIGSVRVVLLVDGTGVLVLADERAKWKKGRCLGSLDFGFLVSREVVDIPQVPMNCRC